MSSWFRKRLTYANVVATMALFIALATGGAYATHENIFSSDIVDGEVKTADIANGAITTAKVGTGQIGSSKIPVGGVNGDDIRNGNVGSIDIAGDAVTASKIGTLIVRTNGGTGEASATCNSGETLIAGGGNAFNNGFVPLGSSEPIPVIGTNEFVSWNVVSTDPNAGVQARVVCLLP